METADRIRARLRQELQQAYAAWLMASQRDDFREAGSQHAKSGAGPTAEDLWASYLAAREKLSEATAGQAPPKSVGSAPPRAGK